MPRPVITTNYTPRTQPFTKGSYLVDILWNYITDILWRKIIVKDPNWDIEVSWYTTRTIPTTIYS